MAIIFQPARIELGRVIRRNAHFLSGKILDVGAGGFDRYGSFISSVEYVHMNMQPGPNTDLVGTAESIPVGDASFDGILCTQVIGDVPDVRTVVREFRRVLRVGGRVLLTEGFMDPMHDQPYDLWRFTPHGLRLLFEEAGFAVLALERIGGYHGVVMQMRTRYLIEKYRIDTKWYGKVRNVFCKLAGKLALWRDHHDTSAAGSLFAHGWLIVAEKK